MPPILMYHTAGDQTIQPAAPADTVRVKHKLAVNLRVRKSVNTRYNRENKNNRSYGGIVNKTLHLFQI